MAFLVPRRFIGRTPDVKQAPESDCAGTDLLAVDLTVRPSQTVLSITHSELSKGGFSSSLSSYCRSMPLTDRLRLVQMLLILRGWLPRHCAAAPT
ncbi:hypothetical protein EYF80_032632 [Liparis tanakae]|uniref:Uncharacterized protein n=1 Tax=Liparis tanakae TaxID=230148 RepID=A0A4Z2GUL8_9TELE|nr:hypothetical protein EYF80_032632 [Liparis tanakae]